MTDSERIEIIRNHTGDLVVASTIHIKMIYNNTTKIPKGTVISQWNMVKSRVTFKYRICVGKSSIFRDWHTADASCFTCDAIRILERIADGKTI